MYNTTKLYGFAKSDTSGGEVFFHLETFWPGESSPDGSVPPPPVQGELVSVTYDANTAQEGKPPRATRVERTAPPALLGGVVERFDEKGGWGFLRGDDGVSYHLHRSEVLDGRLPLVQSRVSFYAGSRKDRPRACYVRVLNG